MEVECRARERPGAEMTFMREGSMRRGSILGVFCGSQACWCGSPQSQCISCGGKEAYCEVCSLTSGTGNPLVDQCHSTAETNERDWF